MSNKFLSGNIIDQGYYKAFIPNEKQKMTNINILHLISTGENETCEFKSSFNTETIETLVAFANTKGGSVLVGVSDSGKLIGVTVQKETIRHWLNEVKSKTSPMLIPDVEAITVNNKTIVAFSVKEYPVKPVAVKGKFYRRLANSNSLMTASEVSELYMQTMQYSWDTYPYPGASLDDLDNEKIESFARKINENERLRISGTVMDILHKLSLIKENKPTNAAMLLFAKEPLMYDIHAGRLKTKDYILDDTIIRNTLFEAVEETMKYIISHLKVAYEISTETVKESTRRKEIFEYPLEALREMVLNAVIHRSYSNAGDIQIKIFDNSISIFNPGKLYGDLTIDDLKSDNYHSSARNKLIVEAFFLTGDIEKYGTGFHRIRTAIRDYPGMEFNYEEMQNGFVSELRYVPVDKNKTDVPNNVPKNVERQEKIIKYLRLNKQTSMNELAGLLNVTRRTIKRDIAELKEQNRIERVGSPRTGYWKVLDNK